MSEFKVTIKTDNAAFDNPSQEVARLLRVLATTVEQGGDMTKPTYITIYDINGNKVGQATRKGAGA